jgi:GAF domain-containing protein
VTDDTYLNSYHNASTPPSAACAPDLVAFMLASDPILADAAELARVVTHAHQAAATQLIGDDWSRVRKYFSLSERYAEWADYRVSAVGFGIHAHRIERPMRFTDAELRAHPEWRNFGGQVDQHPPMRGWLAVPIIGSDRVTYGLLQASDRHAGDFTEQDEANLMRLGTLTATALVALARVHLLDYDAMVAAAAPGEKGALPP